MSNTLPCIMGYNSAIIKENVALEFIFSKEVWNASKDKESWWLQSINTRRGESQAYHKGKSQETRETIERCRASLEAHRKEEKKVTELKGQQRIVYKRLHYDRDVRLLVVSFKSRYGDVCWTPKWRDVIRIFWRALRTEVEENQERDLKGFRRVITKSANLLIKNIK